MNFMKNNILISILSVLTAGCDYSDDRQAPTPELSFEESFQLQLIEAQPGSIIEVPVGTHNFSRSLSLNVSGVTIRGAGMDQSILSFSKQVQGAEGLLVTANDFVIEDLAIENTIGDALKINGSTNVIIRRVRTEWTNGPDSENGAYGIYPVQSRNILIEGSVAIGAADAGIYVGQSSQIIVRNSRAEYNVAGIEIENSTFADVYENVATNNTGGILIFDLPNLEFQRGQSTRVFNNKVYRNNTEMLAPVGAIVGNVPPGTGLLILANDNIEVFDNQFWDNGNVNVMVYSYTLGGRIVEDTNYNPFPEEIYIHDNEFRGGGTDPRHMLLVAWHEITQVNTPNIVWGGLVAEGGNFSRLVCLGQNPSVSFLNLKGGIDPEDFSLDPMPHSCTLPRLEPIELDLPLDD